MLLLCCILKENFIIYVHVCRNASFKKSLLYTDHGDEVTSNFPFCPVHFFTVSQYTVYLVLKIHNLNQAIPNKLIFTNSERSHNLYVMSLSRKLRSGIRAHSPEEIYSRATEYMLKNLENRPYTVIFLQPRKK